MEGLRLRQSGGLNEDVVRTPGHFVYLPTLVTTRPPQVSGRPGTQTAELLVAAPPAGREIWGSRSSSLVCKPSDSGVHTPCPGFFCNAPATSAPVLCWVLRRPHPSVPVGPLILSCGARDPREGSFELEPGWRELPA